MSSTSSKASSSAPTPYTSQVAILLPSDADAKKVIGDAFDPDKPEAKAFIALYQKETGTVPFSLTAYGYDGIRFVAQAIERAGVVDKEKIRVALQGTTGFVGAIGAKGSSWGFRDGKRAGFDPNGAVVRLVHDNQHGPAVHSGAQ